MAEDLGERTEEATPRRLREAREEGNVARSQDLTSAIALGLATLAAWGMTHYIFGEGQSMIRRLLDLSSMDQAAAPATAWQALAHVGWSTMRGLLPFLLLVLAGTWLAQIVQVGFLFSAKSIRFRPDRLDPINGIKRILGPSGLIRVSLDSLKVIIVLSMAVLTVMQYSERLLGLPGLPTMAGVQFIGMMMLDLALRTVAVLLLLGTLDYAWQRWRRRRDLRMTRQQVRDDMKEAEGDPNHRKRRLRLQQQLAMQRVSAAVPRADVIVTNPEHVSVAIAYDPDTMRAPVVIAKGLDHLALRIRQLARRHDVPLVERPPLARALHREVEVNRPIPASFYRAVAEVLAHVQRVNQELVPDDSRPSPEAVPA
ncbi:MAG: EscU/YscU/HrcU family type III secretion system export apparatus switch protein [Planctomycetota bacterium]|nr:EscU/YscU/HrcU family type III secretion system export apparatus switch protein [Planctomycetota bacterium]